MDLTRREMMQGAGALALATMATPALAQNSDGAAEQVLAGIAEELLADYPENASALGIDTGDRTVLATRLTDRSPAGVARLAERTRARLARLQAVDATRISESTRIDLDVVRTAHETAVEGFGFQFGDMAVLNQNWSYRNSPYAVAQNVGAFVEIPDLLDSNHKVENAAGAEAYLARVEAYAAALDGETARLRESAARDIVPPDFIIDKTLRQLRAGAAQPVAENGLVTSLVRRTANIPGDWRRRVTALVTERVQPALARQVAELEAQRPTSTNDAGVWHQPNGEAYYAWALKAATTTTMSPREVHQMGLDQLRMLQAEMDRLLRRRGLTQGTVGARMTALGRDPANLFPNTDAGRQQILDYINGRITDIRTRLPRAFATLVPGNLIVKRVPPEIEAGAPGGYAAAGSIDGTVPGNYYINLASTARWPRYSLPTLSYHEGLPGHIWQGEYTYRLPLIRSLLAFNAYSEGWALYAEQLADELGAYEGDDLGRLGYLQSIAFRCCRLVVDTGLHAERWTRQRGVQFFVDANGSSPEEVQSEVDRYCSWPGQACGYKVGHSSIVALRQRAQRELGRRFDLRLFNDALVKGGNVPLTVLGRVIDRHIGERRGPRR